MSLEGATGSDQVGSQAQSTSKLEARSGTVSQGRDCQAPELVLGHQRVAHLAVQDTQSDTRAPRGSGPSEEASLSLVSE